MLILVPVFAGAAVVCAGDTELEYKVKAAFLLNFARFSSWPAEMSAEAGTPMVFCVVGRDPFGAALSGFESKQVNGQPARLRLGVSLAEAAQCQVLFVSSTEEHELEKIIALTRDRRLVTVSDIVGFAERGGIFEFKNQGNRLSFIINNSKAKEKGIRISSSLLDLALEVL